MKTKSTNPLSLFFNLTVLAAYFHALMEWLFFVTQSSSLSTLSLLDKIEVLFSTGGVIVLLLLALLVVFTVPALKWKFFGYVPAALMVSVTALVMIDNFTYTVFKFGIVSTSGAWRLLYTVAFVLLFYWVFRFVERQKLWKGVSFLSLGLLGVSTVVILSIYNSRSPYMSDFTPEATEASAEHPNILILGSDGLSASYLSAYGFEGNTTPFIAELTQTSLVAENAFPNVSSTTGSTTSALTGKMPAEVQVFRYPDILSKEDSFEHLPGILKHMGYKTVELGTTYYVDARKLNLADGFELVNNVSVDNPILDAIQPLLGNSPSAFFLQTVTERASDRLFHIFFIKEMENPFLQVNNPNARMTDEERTQQIINLLETSDRPVFVFSHYMNTHGPLFSTDDKHVEENEDSAESEKEWDVELYKKAIRTFDDHVREIYTYLEESGKLDNTIIVIYTDHGYRYVVNQRIPIIFHFPNNDHAGTIQNNTQIIDIPATLLDYINVDQPEWMTGSSLLLGEPPAMREIISTTAGSPKKIKPPFYQIKSLQFIVCQKWYSWNVQDNEFKTGEVKSHTAKCESNLLPSDDEIRQRMIEYFKKYNYDTSSLE
ncbi:MAG TPA: sulfatase-like hydrolase/transferase [Anaerolineales bacterium]|nr:sulfatase-like hydrolase/transferase [Anaerolineales bacterium]